MACDVKRASVLTEVKSRPWKKPAENKKLKTTYNHGQKSRDKFALLALLCTRQKRTQLHLPDLAPIPNIMLKLLPAISLFLLIFNIVLGWEGNSYAFLKGEQRFFKLCKTQIIHQITYVSQELLSTIIVLIENEIALLTVSSKRQKSV